MTQKHGSTMRTAEGGLGAQPPGTVIPADPHR